MKCCTVTSKPVNEPTKSDLTFDFGDFPLPKEWKDRVTQYADVFDQHNLDFGHASKVKRHINLKVKTPFEQKSRPIHANNCEAVRIHLQTLPDAGVIRESGSPYSLPIVVV